MHAKIYANPRFILWITTKELDTLIGCSQLHYDAVCRDAHKPGNFLYGWMSLGSKSAEKEFTVMANSREIDICLKILVMPAQQFEEIAKELSTSLRGCYLTANKHLGHIDIAFNPAKKS